MTKTYELPNEKMIMADVDEKHHTATVSVYILDDLVESVNKTGHWVKGKCDQCGEHAPFWSMATTYYESEYCPKCGARMESEQNG